MSPAPPPNPPPPLSVYDKVFARLKQTESVKAAGNFYLYEAMKVIKKNGDAEFFLAYDDDCVQLYLNEHLGHITPFYHG